MQSNSPQTATEPPFSPPPPAALRKANCPPTTPGCPPPRIFPTVGYFSEDTAEILPEILHGKKTKKSKKWMGLATGLQGKTDLAFFGVVEMSENFRGGLPCGVRKRGPRCGVRKEVLLRLRTKEVLPRLRTKEVLLRLRTKEVLLRLRTKEVLPRLRTKEVLLRLRTNLQLQ